MPIRKCRSRERNGGEACKTNPPPLSIATIKSADDGTPLPDDIEMCGVVAGTAIPKGTIIAEYTGELKSLNYPEDGTYYVQDFPPVDGRQYRSDASMTNCAFPNAHLIHLAKGKSFGEGLDGLPFRKFIVATSDIAEGEEIVWNYGAGYNFGQQVELKSAALKRFLKNVSWKDLVQSFKKHDTVIKDIGGTIYFVFPFLSFRLP